MVVHGDKKKSSTEKKERKKVHHSLFSPIDISAAAS